MGSMDDPWERWHRWVGSLGCPNGQPEALELEYDDIVRLEPMITYALMNTRDILRMESLDGEPLSMMELRNYVEAGEGCDTLVLWFRVPWFPSVEA